MIERRALMAGLLGGAAGAALLGEAAAAKGKAKADLGFDFPSIPFGPGLVFFGGCIRFESITEGPYIHSNSVHYNIGLSSVVVRSDGDVRVTFDRTVPIVTGFVDEDESFATAGISAGFSGGSGLANLRFGSPSGVRILPTSTTLWKPNRNLWLGFVGADL